MALISRTTWESPQQLFSSTDRVAVLVARLCILREDIYLELVGLSAASVTAAFNGDPSTAPGLEDNGKLYRQLYFLRASIKSIVEIQETIQRLNGLEPFRMIIAKTSETETLVRDYLKRLNINLDSLRRLRNNLGGHVSEDAVQEALSNIQNITETGKLDVGKTHRDTHYGFVIPLCAQMLMLKVAQDDRQEFLEKISTLNDQTLTVVDAILVEYLDNQGYFHQ